jgi:hypothetical protein
LSEINEISNPCSRKLLVLLLANLKIYIGVDHAAFTRIGTTKSRSRTLDG